MSMDLRIVAVGFDGSPDSIVALRWASSLCAALGATLKVVHIVGLLEEQHLIRQPSVSVELATEIATGTGLRAEGVEWVLQSGSPADALLQMTQSPHEADLLVVGSRGIERRTGFTLGSTSGQVAQEATVPVAIIPNPG